MAWILEEGEAGSGILEVSGVDSTLEMLIPLCLLESPRGRIAILLMEEEARERWRRGRPTQELGYMSTEGSSLRAVKSSSQVISIFSSSRQEGEVDYS